MRFLGFILMTSMLFGGCDDGSGPEIMPLEDQRVLVNDTLILDLRVREAQGDETWSFSAPSIPDIDRHAALYQSGGTASFRWSPLASHASPVPHQFSFTVESGGETDTETINIEVVQAGGAPRFIQPPPGGTYDLGVNPQVVVDIEVIDEDSVNVSITEREPLIQGGNISQADGHRARWTWTPTQQQVDSTLRYTLNLEASDGEHDPVRQSYDIVLLTEGKENCPGTGPVITVMAADRYETVQDYEVHATIVDDQRLRDDPILFYSAEAPDTANPDVTRMTLVTATKVSGDEYAAFIPNLGLPNPGEERTIYFVWSATDNDDAEGTACDHTTRSQVGQFTAVEPTEVDLVGYCAPCTADRQCENGLCVVAEPSFCGVACGSSCAEGTCQSITSRGGSTDQQCVPDELRCGGGTTFNCTPDGSEPGSNEMTTAPPITLGTTVNGTICEDDYDYYSINLTASSPYVFTATGWNADEADIDLLLFDASDFLVDFTDSTEGTEIMEHCPVDSGIHYILVLGYTAEDMGPYSLQVTAGSESCAPPCERDSYEDNETRETAETITCGTGVSASICPGDEDFFRVSVSTSSTLEATIACASGDDIDLYIQDSAGATLDRGITTACSEEASAPVAAGTYYLRVRGFGGSANYTLNCNISAGGGCSDTTECPAGNVCEPTSGCMSDFCDDPGATGECPTDHFCPEPGGIAGASACVDNCATSADCRTGYACKAFEDGFFRGCGREGSGLTGGHCEGFWECAGERTCLTAGSDGYCAEVDCFTGADCPTDSQCVDVGGFQNICLVDCLAGDEICESTAGECVDTTDVDSWVQFVCALSHHSVPPGW